MTCREKLAIEHPNCVDPKYQGGCRGCPHEYGYLPVDDCMCRTQRFASCTKCWDSVIPGTEENNQPVTGETEPKNINQIDIHKLIDDAMEKKDREVSIFIMKDTTSVYVRPVGASDPRWIMHEENASRHVVRYEFECSECRTYREQPTPYCPICGEKLRMPTMDDKEIKCASEDSAIDSVKEDRDDA